MAAKPHQPLKTSTRGMSSPASDWVKRCTCPSNDVLIFTLLRKDNWERLRALLKLTWLVSGKMRTKQKMHRTSKPVHLIAAFEDWPQCGQLQTGVWTHFQCPRPAIFLSFALPCNMDGRIGDAISLNSLGSLLMNLLPPKSIFWKRVNTFQSVRKFFTPGCN